MIRWECIETMLTKQEGTCVHCLLKKPKAQAGEQLHTATLQSVLIIQRQG